MSPMEQSIDSAVVPAIETPLRRGSLQWRDWAFVMLLLVGTLLVYRPAWQGAPVYDDTDHLTPPELQSVHGLAQIWTQLGVVSQYYPVTHSVFWLEHRLWGDAMLGYHLVNVVLHVCTALLLLKLLRRLAVPGAMFAAALFALHPMMVESVAWISELKNTLSGAFCLATACAYLEFDAHRRPRAYAFALALFVAGLLSKGVIATLPAALLVIFWWRRGRLSGRGAVLPLLPFFIVGIAGGLFTAWVERKFIGADGAAFNFSLIERALIAGRVACFYLSHLFWPANLTFIYPRWSISAASLASYFYPAAIIALLVIAWAWRARSRAPLAALLLFVGSLVPVLGFLNVYPFRYSFVADHYCYLASASVIALVGAALAQARAKSPPWLRRPATIAPAVLLLTSSALSWRQTHIYRDDETLWRATIARNPGAFLAYSNLSVDLLARGELDEAIATARKAITLEPNYAEPYNSLANALHRQGKSEEALANYRKALAIRPDLAQVHCNVGYVLQEKGQLDDAIVSFERAVSLRPEFVRAHVSLANALLRKQRIDEAIVHLQAALAIIPDDADAQSNLGNALLQKGDLDAAIVHLRRAIAAQPANPMTHDDLGNALLQKGELDDAIVEYRQALAINPRFDLAHYNLGFALLKKNQPDAAASALEQAIALSPKVAPAEYQLGNAGFQAGRPDDAIRHYERAIALQPDFIDARLNLIGVLFQARRIPDVVTQSRAALGVQPDNVRVMSSLAWLLATWNDAAVRNGPEALRLAKRADELTGGKDAMVIRALAAAYAESGQYTDAVGAAERALRVAEAAGDIGLAADLRAQIKQHQARLPMRDPAG